MSFEDTGIAKIRSALERKGEAVLLAQLGELLDVNERPQGKLGAALINHGIEILQGTREAEIYGALPGQSMPSKQIIKPIKTRNFKHALLVAFTKMLEPGDKLYVSLTPKFKFDVIKPGEKNNPGTIPLDDKYRLPGMNPEKKEFWKFFEKNLSEWVQAYAIPVELLEWRPSPLKDSKEVEMVSILKDFVLAQPPELRNRICLPCSVLAQILKINR